MEKFSSQPFVKWAGGKRQLFTALIKELYSDFRQKIVNVKRSINCDAANRNGEEIIIWNF